MGNASVKPHPRSRHIKKQVHWRAADRPSPPGKPQLVAEKTDLTPDVVTIRWSPPKNDGGSPITGYLVEHRRYGSPHWVRATPLLVRAPELSLSGLEPGWRYQFRISCENAVGLSSPGEVSDLLTVTLQRSAVAAPRFVDELIDTVALENEKVEFIVQFIGQPTPNICWFKDGFEIFSSRRIRIITENDKSVLTIHQSSLSDEGEIKCTATNKIGHASTKSKLTLEAPPSIRLPRQYEDGLLFEIGEAMRFKVSIAGRPAPLIFWSHNNETIKEDDKYEIECTEKYASVKIEEATRNDRGEYQIKAINKLGEAFTSFLVTITDKPSPPGQARVAMTLGRSVTLSWNLPHDDGGCKIGNYIVEYFRIGWDVWLKAATCRQLSTTIGDLIEGSEYKFRVKAESPYGISEPSKESDVIFIPDPKRGILAPRGRSQPRDTSSEPKKKPPRSQSSTRAETLPGRVTPVHFYEGGIPVRPARTKIKSPSITPEPSPTPKRRTLNINTINKGIFDRASIARDLAYGSPEFKVEKPEFDEVEKPSKTVNVINKQNLNEFKINTQLKNSPKLERNTRPLLENRPEPKKQDKPKSPNPKPSSLVIEKPKSVPPQKSSHKDFEFYEKIEAKKSPPHSPKIEPQEILKKPTGDLYLEEYHLYDTPMSSSSEAIEKKSPSPKHKSPSPVLEKSRSFEEKAPSPISFLKNRYPTPPRLEEKHSSSLRHDELSNSSEFMLVLLPENERGRRASDVNFDFDEISTPPPMSLSAPELGSELLFFEPLRPSVSSSELLHEHMMARFYADMENEEAERIKQNLALNNNLPQIPKIQINSKDDQVIVGLERKNSLKRRYSGGIVTSQHLIWAHRRSSLKSNSEQQEIPENSLRRFPIAFDHKSTEEEEKIVEIAETNLPLASLTVDEKRSILMSRQRSHSEEREEEEFERVRAKMAVQRKDNKKSVAVVQEEDWEQEFEESVSGTETESSEDERRKEARIPRIDVQHEEELAMYRPNFSSRKIVNQSIKSKYDEPFEILTKPNPLPDPNFVPKPILKRREIEEIPDKPLRKTNANNSQQSSTNPNQLNSTKRISVFPQKQKEKDKPAMRKRASSPAVPFRKFSEHPDFSLGANKPAPPKRSDEEIKVVVDHYGDIVRSCSQRKTTLPKVYLNAEDLKAEAERQSKDDLRQISESIENLNKEDLDDEEDELLKISNLSRRRSFIEASSALFRTVKDSVAAALSGDQVEDDVIPPDAEIIPHVQRRGSSQFNALTKRRSSKPINKLDVPKSPKKPSPSKTPARGENWSNLRAPSPSPQGGRSSRSPMRRTSLAVHSAQSRRSSLTSITASSKPKMKETMTQTMSHLDSYSSAELSAKAEYKVRTTVDYLTDLAMFIVACWLYLFQNELLAIPVLLVMVYRQLKEEIRKKLPKWMFGKKKVKRK